MHLDPARLSAYGRRSTRPSPVNRMMSAFAADFRPTRDINLGVGYVNERTIPRLPIQQALNAVLADPARYKAALNYGGPQGSDNLIAALQRLLQRTSFATAPDAVNRQQIIIGPSGATSLLEALARVLAPGIVITADPMYYIYCDVLERVGHRVVAIAEDAEGLQPTLLEQLVASGAVPIEQLNCVYVVTVNNPTGTIMTTQRRRQLAETVARLSRQAGRLIPLVVDRAYDDLVHDPAVEPVPSCLIDPPADCLIYEVGTLSKVLSPALRIGYLVGPDTPLLQALIQKTSDTGFSAPLITQEMAGWLLDQHIETQLARVNRGYRENRWRSAPGSNGI